jgi:hypothetical protein
MASISFTANWEAVPNAESYRVVFTVNGAEIYTLQGSMLLVTRVLNVQDGDIVGVSVVASNVSGESVPGEASLVASVVAPPAAPVVSLTQG